jgi:hypothetical protein
MKYENIVFIQTENETKDFFDIFDNKGKEAAFEYLKQWHYPGEHETRDNIGNGTSDKLYYFGNEDYCMTINSGLRYVGLTYKIKE